MVSVLTPNEKVLRGQGGGGNPAIDWYHVQGEIETFPVASFLVCNHVTREPYSGLIQ